MTRSFEPSINFIGPVRRVLTDGNRDLIVECESLAGQPGQSAHQRDYPGEPMDGAAYFPRNYFGVQSTGGAVTGSSGFAMRDPKNAKKAR